MKLSDLMDKFKESESVKNIKADDESIKGFYEARRMLGLAMVDSWQRGDIEIIEKVSRR